MSPQESYAKDIERLLMDCRKRLNEAADRGQITEVTRLSDQISSLSRLLEAAS